MYLSLVTRAIKSARLYVCVNVYVYVQHYYKSECLDTSCSVLRHHSDCSTAPLPKHAKTARDQVSLDGEVG